MPTSVNVILGVLGLRAYHVALFQLLVLAR
jgi:hypothetical protein